MTAESVARPHVLVVDDDPDITRLIGVQLARDDFEVTEVHGGDEALRVARARPTNLVLLDLRMEPTTGLDVIRELRADPRTSSIPILVVSVVDIRQRVIEHGADAFILKPFRPADLVAKARKMVGRDG